MGNKFDVIKDARELVRREEGQGDVGDEVGERRNEKTGQGSPEGGCAMNLSVQERGGESNVSAQL